MVWMVSFLKKRAVVLISVFVLFLNPYFLFSQEENYTNYTTKDGLPSNQVYKIIQDDIGYIWFLTDKGISKFDGYEFENFSSVDGLSANVFFDAQKTDEGDIWILGMNGSITIINPYSNGFSHYEYNDSLIKYRNLIGLPNKIYLNDDGLIITYAFIGGFLKISRNYEVKNSTYKFHHLSKNCHSISIEGAFHIAKQKDTSGHFFGQKLIPYVNDFGFFLDERKTAVLIHSKDSVLIETPDRKIRISIPNIIDAGRINNQLFWVSSKFSGLFIVNRKGILLEQKVNKTVVTDFFSDKEDNKWFSTLNNGVFLEENSVIKKYHFLIQEDNGIHDLIDYNNELYVGHENGNVSKITEKGIVKVVTSTDKAPAVFANNNDKLYFFSGSKFYSLDTSITILYDNALPAVNDVIFRENNSFICYTGGYNILMPGQIFKLIYRVRRINTVETYSGKEYFASDNGLFIEKKNNDTSYLELSTVYQKRVNDLTSNDSILFLATHGEGLILVKNDKIYSRISGAELSSNYINSIYAENDSTLYLCTNKGISKLSFSDNFSKFSSTIINQFQGLNSIEINDVEILNDTLWIAAIQGLYFLPLDYFSKEKNVKEFALEIRGVEVNDVIVKKKEGYEFSYFENKIQFNFSIISFKSAQNTIYRYKLNDVDKDWIYSKNRVTTYSGLNPGDYEFTVQVKGENLSWESQSQSILIVINPPLWKTWWFIGLVSVFAILLVYLFFRVRILLYNKDLVREMLRQILKRIKKPSTVIVVREGNKDVKLFSQDINFVKSDGNYLEIHHEKGKTIIRHKIGEFLELVPDPIEFIQIRRSYIIRIDKVDQVGKNFVIAGDRTIKVGSTFQIEFNKIKL